MIKSQLRVVQAIWKDKSIPKEAKYIYAYIYSKGYNRYFTDINVGEIQQTVRITNKGLRKNLEKLEHGKYLVYQEYDNGMYIVKLN